ncbi:MAG: hypothetical protein J2P15_11700, partial [Micromonosporaceae bacterium]|nr:hypothetical protein [Micromonosporaceae bacterium]
MSLHIPRRSLPIAAAGILLVALALTPPATAAPTAQAPAAAGKPSCANTVRLVCAEVDDYDAAFNGQYVGHDEPSLLFYSDQAGAGNSMQYQLTLPRDPAPNPIAGRSYNFMLHPALWLGMAVCDTQSYPQQVSTCAPDSDANITTSLAKHPGTA